MTLLVLHALATAWAISWMIQAGLVLTGGELLLGEVALMVACTFAGHFSNWWFRSAGAPGGAEK
jgi:hypothetical protein